MEELRFQIADEMEDERIDKCMSLLVENLSRSFIQKLIKDGNVLVNGTPVKGSCRVKCDDEVVFSVPESVEPDIEPENIPLDILYEDADLIVVNKPKGMVVHPAAGNPDGTLVNALLHHCCGQLSGINGEERPGIVHRIDRNTSGLLMVAKTDAAHHSLSAQIQAHSFTREYQAVAVGRFREPSGTIDAPIGRHPVDRKKMCVTQKNSKRAVTHYETILAYQKATHLRLRLETGRTHQIRVHLAYLGHPVLGDDVYGKPYPGLEGQCLHAAKIGFVHPTTGQYLEFESPLPDYFRRVLRQLRT